MTAVKPPQSSAGTINSTESPGYQKMIWLSPRESVTRVPEAEMTESSRVLRVRGAELTEYSRVAKDTRG